MRGIADKIRLYRKTFRPPVLYALTSSIFWLTVSLAAFVVSLTFFDLYVRLTDQGELLSSGDQGLLLLAEIPMLFGIVQIHLVGAERRFRYLNPVASRISMRTPYRNLDREKISFIRRIFSQQESLRALASHLVEEWEWREEIKRRAQDPIWLRAIGFFRLPSTSNFATYMAGLVAILAAILITTITPDTLFGALETLPANAWSIIRNLTIVIVLPIALCVLPTAVIMAFVKDIGVALLERLNDQYLSQAGFYRFISQLLELHDVGERMLLRKTHGRVYWAVRMGIAPLQDLKRIRNRIRRAKRLAKQSALPR